jgi:hypothetical protein
MADRQYTALFALFQVYGKIDCWCGCGFADVVDRFARWNIEIRAEEGSELEGLSRRFTELDEVVGLAPSRRQKQLEMDALDFLREFPTEEQRRSELEKHDAGGLIASDIWDPEGAATERRIERLLKLVVAHARSWDPAIWDSLGTLSPEALADPLAVAAHNQRAYAILEQREAKVRANLDR